MKNDKTIDKTSLFLILIFIILVIIVIVLSVVLYKKKEKDKKILKQNITIPIIKVDNLPFKIKALELSNSDEFVFKITNHLNEELLKEDLSYEIIINNPTDSILELYMNYEENSLLKIKKEAIIEGNALSTTEKEEIFYRIKMKKYKNIKNKDLINVLVRSKKVD